MKIAFSFFCGVAVGFIIYKHWNIDSGRIDPAVVDKDRGSNLAVKKTDLANNVAPNQKAPSSATKMQSHNVAKEEGGDDSYVPTDLEKALPSPQRWATREGIMEVAHETNESKSVDIDEVEKWRTRQGVIDVATETIECPDDAAEREVSKFSTREGIMEISQQCRKEDELKKILLDQRRGFKMAEALNRKLRKSHDAIQVAITNSSTKERQITLWGTNTPVSVPLQEDVEDLKQGNEIPLGIHPQGVICNPFNSLVYAADQLSNTVTVCTPEGAIVKTISLEPTGFPGICSPVDFAAHTISGKLAFGKVYVVCSVANTVITLNTNLELSAIVTVGTRPVAITFNPINELVYIANLASNNVSVLDTNTGLVILTIPVGVHPSALLVNPNNGDVYVANRASNSVMVYDKNNIYVTTINGLNVPIALFWHPVQMQVYVTLENANEIVRLDPVTHEVLNPIALPNRHRTIALHPGNGFLYVTGNGTITVLDILGNVKAVISASGINIGFIIHPDNYTLFWTSTTASVLKAASVSKESSFISTDYDGLNTQLNEFRNHPPTISHVKIIVSGSKPLSNLIVREFSISGKQKDTPISISSYRSPQHFLNVFEVDAFRQTTIDGFTQWIFAMPALTSATLLIYYKPFRKGAEEIIKKSLEQVHI
jgi:YVTN family beta-propeller protein